MPGRGWWECSWWRRSRSLADAGLGLAIAPQVTTDNKGTIEIDSAVVQGTTVRLLLSLPNW